MEWNEWNGINGTDRPELSEDLITRKDEWNGMEEEGMEGMEWKEFCDRQLVTGCLVLYTLYNLYHEPTPARVPMTIPTNSHIQFIFIAIMRELHAASDIAEVCSGN